MMIDQAQIHYDRIVKAIEYIQENFKQQPTLEDIAATVHLSPFYFQRLFSEWAGVSPKKFVQYLSLEHAKGLLKNRNSSLMEAAYETGLSGASRLHDLFVKIECMTPGEFKNGGKALCIDYCFANSPFGKVMIASTSKGVCRIAFEEDEVLAFSNLNKSFPNASYTQRINQSQQAALFIFQKDWSRLDEIKLHLNGTPFQLKVWECLLKIPMGDLTTYGHIATAIGNSNASRAVGTAISRNPVAFLIPCHRVIQSSGQIGGYMWGATRKSAMISWEAARTGA